MKRVAWIAVLWLLIAGVWRVVNPHGSGRNKRPTAVPPAPAGADVHSTPLDSKFIEAARSTTTGESHSQAVSQLVDFAKHHQTLAAADIQKLLAFIGGPKPEGLKDGEWAERVNVILNALRAQEACVPGLTDYLLTTARSHPSRVLRLFAMQHLSLWYGRETSADKRREIVTLLETLAEKDGEGTAGSAVMFLSDLQREAAATGGEVVKAEVIDRAALKLAADPGVKHDVRISALHTCVARNIKEILPAAREIAADTSAVIPLRKAAVYSIGQLGAADDRMLLESLGKEVRDLRPTTDPALKNLSGVPKPK